MKIFCSHVQTKFFAIRNAERPRTKKQVRSFLGLVVFYRAFIQNFAEIAAALTELTKKGQKNNWVKWEKAFGQLRMALINQTILKMADLSKPFILQVDASDIELGAVLL